MGSSISDIWIKSEILIGRLPTVGMKPFKTEYKKTMAWLIFTALIIIFGIVLALSVNMKVKPVEGS